MDTANRFVLTDVERNIASESVRIDEGVLSLGAGQDWSVEKTTLRGGLQDGVDLLTVDNGHLSFQIIPTRFPGSRFLSRLGTFPVPELSPTFACNLPSKQPIACFLNSSNASSFPDQQSLFTRFEQQLFSTSTSVASMLTSASIFALVR